MAYDFNSLNLLIADDSKHMRAMLSTICSAFGFASIKFAADGTEAFAILKTFPADLIITDWLMRPMDGLTFIRKVRHDPESPNPYVPIIMMTGYSHKSRVVEALDAGVTDVLVKPVTPEILSRRVVDIIERPRPYIRVGSYFGPQPRHRTVEELAELMGDGETVVEESSAPV